MTGTRIRRTGRRLPPIRVESVGTPVAVSSLAALLLALSNRPTLRVVPTCPSPKTSPASDSAA
jgi:hypothetical protein